jgi:hypothetical protein
VDGSGASPVGLHRLDDVGFNNAAKPGTSGAYISNDSPLLARVATQGLVLVTEATTSGAKGALFGLMLKSPAGNQTDSLPYGTFSVP